MADRLAAAVCTIGLMDDGVGSFDRVDLVAVTAPHPLSPFESYRFENTGRGASSAFNPPTCALRSELSPLHSHSSALFCTFLRPTKTQLFSFHAIPHSASKNRAAWDTPRNFRHRDQNNQASAKTCSTDDTLCHLHRQPTRSGASALPAIGLS